MLFPQKIILRKSSVVTLLIFIVIGSYLLIRPRLVSSWAAKSPQRPPVGPEKYAYVFYATANTYACSALVNAHRLRNVLNSTVPIILIAGRGVNTTTIDIIKASSIKITVIEDTAPPLAPNAAEYYTEVLLKLRAFRLHRVIPALRRVVALDSDQLVRKNLDHLFLLPAADVAAPLMYWGKGTGVTTALMVATLSNSLWGIVNGALHHMRPNEYDMDLINRVLKKRLMVLPGRYCTLNSHWEAQDTPGWFKGIKTTAQATSQELEALYDEVEVLHFTAMEKPWNVLPERIASDRVVQGKSKVHPLFVQQFEEWHMHAKEVCSDFWERVPPVVIPPPDSLPTSRKTLAVTISPLSV